MPTEPRKERIAIEATAQFVNIQLGGVDILAWWEPPEYGSLSQRREALILVVDDGVVIDNMVAEILDVMRPRLAAALRAAFERGQQVSGAHYADRISRATRLLNELSQIAPEPDNADVIPVGSVWTHSGAERAALGTVKPRILELVSREVGASVQEIEAIGIKPNSIRGTLYALQKDGHIQRRGDRWYAAAPKSNEAPSDKEEAPQG